MAPRRRRAGETVDEVTTDTPKKTRKPKNDSLSQQRLKAWQCILTPRLVVLSFSILAAVFLGFGSWIFYLSFTVRDITIDYTNCAQNATNEFTRMPDNLIEAHFTGRRNPLLNAGTAEWMRSTKEVEYDNKTYKENETVCTVQFKIPQDMNPPIMFLYKVENFYQNHRRYVQSFSQRQLAGYRLSSSELNGSNCLETYSWNEQFQKPVYPCGAIAASLFNDTFSSPIKVGSNDTGVPYNMTKDVAWSGMDGLFKKTSYNASDVAPPPNWVRRYKYGYRNENLPDISSDPAFQNWMMIASTPTFYKAYQRNRNETLTNGTYQVEIVDNWPVTDFNARKSFMITTLTAMGSRNIWPGIIFLAVGGVCLILDIYFVLSYFIWKPRKLGDPSYLSWNQPAAQGARGGAAQ